MTETATAHAIRLNGSVAVVTGGNSGIGRAIALGLSAERASLALVARTITSLQEVAITTLVTSPRVEFYPADLTIEEEIVSVANRIRNDFGRVDILVHSAGEIVYRSFEAVTPAEFDRQFAMNVKAPYLLTQALLPDLKSAHGQVVFINSSAGLAARSAMAAHYSATKHALRAMADGLREEVNSAGVRVISVYPGRTASPMQKKVHDLEGAEYRPDELLQPEDVASVVLNALTMARTAEVTDISIRPMRKASRS